MKERLIFPQVGTFLYIPLLTILTVGFMIYRLKDKDLSELQLGEEFFKYTPYSALSGNFSDAREVTGRFRLPPGRYVIVPSTYHPGTEGEFLLRTFTEKIREPETNKMNSEYDQHVNGLTSDGQEHKKIQRGGSREKKIEPIIPTSSSGTNDESRNSMNGKKLSKGDLEYEVSDKEKKEKKRNSNEECELTAPVKNCNNVILKTKEKYPKPDTSYDEENDDKKIINRFKYENEDDEKWACITSPGTTVITIITSGTNMVNITLMEKVNKDVC